MKKTLAALSISFLVVAGCATKNTSNSQPLSNYYSTRTEIAEPKKTEKKWIKLVEGSDLMYEEGGHHLSDGGTNFSKSEWDNFLKKFIEELPKEKRDAALRFLIQSKLNYDELEKRILFEKRIYSQDLMAHIQIIGVIKDNQLEASLKLEHDLGNSLTYLGLAQEHRSFGTGKGRFKVYADNFIYEREVEFRSDPEFKKEGAELGQLDFDSIGFLGKLANAEKSTIRYFGTKYYYDFIFDQKEKEKLKIALKALTEIIQIGEEKLIPTNNINIQMHETQHKKKKQK